MGSLTEIDAVLAAMNASSNPKGLAWTASNHLLHSSFHAAESQAVISAAA